MFGFYIGHWKFLFHNPKIFEISSQNLAFFFCINNNFQMKKFDV